MTEFGAGALRPRWAEALPHFLPRSEGRMTDEPRSTVDGETARNLAAGAVRMVSSWFFCSGFAVCWGAACGRRRFLSSKSSAICEELYPRKSENEARAWRTDD